MSATIIQISDTHILAGQADTFDGVDTAASLTAVMTHIRTHEQPDLILLTGDLVHEPDRASYDRLNELLNTAPCGVYVVPGNHDDPDLMASELTTPVCHARDIKTDCWRILMLNTWLKQSHAGYLPAEELSWFESRLTEQPAINTLIAMHHPPVSIGSTWMDAMGLRNAGEFLDIIDRQPQIRAVVWGHIHQVFESERGGIKLLSCPSTCVQFKPGSETYTRDDLPPGYRRLELLDRGEIVSEVIRV